MKSIRIIMAFALSLLLAVSFIGCTQKNSEPSEQPAATVNGTEILEADVTARIETWRIDQSTGEPLDDTAWAEMLKSANYTPETLRESTIRNQFAVYILILQKAAEAGITPDSAAVDQSLTETKESIESSGGTWEDHLKSMGYYSETAYRQKFEAENVAEKLVEAQVADAVPTQEEIETYVSENAAARAGKRVSVIYLPYDAPVDETATEGEETTSAETADEATITSESAMEVMRPKADEALAKLREGADFAEVAKEYSLASSVASDGGDLGWGSEGSLPEDVRAVLSSLPKDEISDVLETNFVDETSPSYAFVIVKWRAAFIVPEDQAGQPVDFATVPADIIDELTEYYTTTEKSTAQQQYLTSLIQSDEIVINPMPEGLSYDVDMNLANTAEETTAEPEETTAEPEGPSIEPVDEVTELQIIDTLEGSGPEAKEGDAVEVDYTGYLADGTFFESSTFTLTIGQGQVIQGWELGLVGMKVGGERRLIIPPDLAYGETGSGNTIPPNATLVFDLVLLSVNGDSTGVDTGR
jgi:FKBP-type peptidyl-prolyl cis-trans isomerase